MTSIGTALINTLSHSDTEKLFIPWWDNLEDFVIYGLITLGLIVLPTQVFSGTPLFCTVCLEDGQCGVNATSSKDPEYQAWFVRNYCTQNAVSQFTLYFPYILLFLPMVLVGIERFFNRLFSSNTQIEGLSALLSAAKRAEIDDSVTTDTNVDDTVKTVEVRQSFKEQGNFYKSYMIRTLCEFVVGVTMSGYLWFMGIIEIEQDFDIICQIREYFYECSGVPTQFYLYILWIALVMLCLYMITTFFTLCWLVCPWWGRLATFMKDYEKLLRREAVKQQGEDTDGAWHKRDELLGEMNDIYYENNDLRLLLDLLAATTGLSQPIRVIALLDRSFRRQCIPDIITFERVADIQKGEGDLRLVISESELARNVFAKMKNLSCIYTVQLTPRTDKASLDVVVFDRPEVEEDYKKVFNFFRRATVKAEPEPVPVREILFPGADTDTSYTVKVSLVLNGQAIAVAQKSLKALMDPATQAALDAQNTVLAAQLVAANNDVSNAASTATLRE